MEPASTHPRKLLRWEWWVLFLLATLCLVLAVAGKGRKQAIIYDDFLRRAPLIQEGLEAFAKEHEGRFPPDAMFTRRPAGLEDRYIAWSDSWNIDYDVHPNDKGGWFVCLEFVGPYGQPEYFALCQKPDIRKNYGKGEPIPGHSNRIWLVRENAPIMPPIPRP
jgi:hypothetical protein